MLETINATRRTTFPLLALLVFASVLGLGATLHFPEVLLDPPSFGTSLVRANPVGVLASLLGLLAAGALLMRHARHRLGVAAGACWALSALLGLLLVLVWVPQVAWIAFACGAIAAPLLLASWTASLVRHRGRVLGTLGAVGLLLTAARSTVWALNAVLPPDRGLYLTSAILTVAALLTFPLWLAWRCSIRCVPPGFRSRWSAKAPRGPTSSSSCTESCKRR